MNGSCGILFVANRMTQVLTRRKNKAAQALIEAVASKKQYHEAKGDCSLAFCASTGRTATMFVAKTLNTLPRVLATHEGHVIDDVPSPVLPLINFHNRKAWHDQDYAARTIEAMRSKDVLSQAAGNASVVVDVAFNNAPFMEALAAQHPAATFLAIFRRCEGFVRSATLVTGEDTQPAGWPDRQKPLTDREKFIELGRLKPADGSEYGELWDDWSAIQRNIWLWSTVNSHLFRFINGAKGRCKLLFEDLVNDPAIFWTTMLASIGQNTPDNLDRCIALSTRKTNQRAAYQIGPFAEWSKAERALYETIALPLEDEIYG